MKIETAVTLVDEYGDTVSGVTWHVSPARWLWWWLCGFFSGNEPIVKSPTPVNPEIVYDKLGRALWMRREIPGQKGHRYEYVRHDEESTTNKPIHLDATCPDKPSSSQTLAVQESWPNI